MKSALVFLLALVALSQAGVPKAVRCRAQHPDARVVNGRDVELGEIPYQVSLQIRSNKFHFCGGSIVNKDYVLTAAHCVHGESPSNIQVVAGTVNLDAPKSVHLALQIITHKDYKRSDFWINDIALVKVSVPFVRTHNVDYVPLPKKGLAVPAESCAVLSGWGRLREGGQSPKKLQRTQLLISTHEHCTKIYGGMGYTVHASHICANDPDFVSGACHGDSGSPLTVGGKIVGIASWTNGCGSIKYPTVYTKVAAFIDWINEHAA